MRVSGTKCQFHSEMGSGSALSGIKSNQMFIEIERRTVYYNFYFAKLILLNFTLASPESKRSFDWMSSREFVDPVHKNVDVLTFSVASRVILDMDSAKGIEVKRFGKTLEYFACNEVILSAGAIGSPQGLNPLYVPN